MRVKKEFLEINKPSELCQVLYFTDYKKMVYAQLTPTQIDLMNVITYQARKHFISKKIELNYDYASVMIELELKEVSEYFNKYKHNDYHQLIEQLNGLRKLDIVFNVLKKNKYMETTLTSFIHELTISKHKENNKKIVKVHISTKVLGLFLDVKKLFTKMHLQIQFSMKSKYSKLLYELLKDYEGINSKIIDYDLLIGLINAGHSERYNTFSYFNNDILKKAIKEINDKSDIKVSYEPIKERPDGGRLQVTKIKFMMKKQKCDLIDNQEPELSIEEQIKYNKKKVITEQRLKQAKQFQEIKNEDAWIKKTIESITDEFLEQQDKIESAKEQIDNINIKDYTDKLSIKYGDIIGLDKYKLIYIFDESKPSITNNANETLDILSNL